MSSPEKTTAVILSVTPYRETSCIMRLFTQTHGLIHGIAKGVRGKTKNFVPTDRGMLVEFMLYYKPNRDLHTIGNFAVTDFFPSIRGSIIKTALRDIALELYLKTITQPEVHVELFDLLRDFLEEVEQVIDDADDKKSYPYLWRFIYNYCQHSGFAMDKASCEQCGIGGGLIDFLCGRDDVISNNVNNNSNNTPPLAITARMLQYARQHFDIKPPFNALDFLRELG